MSCSNEVLPGSSQNTAKLFTGDSGVVSGGGSHPTVWDRGAKFLGSSRRRTRTGIPGTAAHVPALGASSNSLMPTARNSTGPVELGGHPFIYLSFIYHYWAPLIAPFRRVTHAWGTLSHSNTTPAGAAGALRRSAASRGPKQPQTSAFLRTKTAVSQWCHFPFSPSFNPWNPVADPRDQQTLRALPRFVLWAELAAICSGTGENKQGVERNHGQARLRGSSWSSPR